MAEQDVRLWLQRQLDYDPAEDMEVDSPDDALALIAGHESYDLTTLHPTTGVPVRVLSMALLRVFLREEKQDMDWFRDLPSVQQKLGLPGWEWLDEVFYDSD